MRGCTLKTRQSTATNQQFVQPHGNFFNVNWSWVYSHVVALLRFRFGSGRSASGNTVLDLGLYFRRGENSILRENKVSGRLNFRGGSAPILRAGSTNGRAAKRQCISIELIISSKHINQAKYTRSTSWSSI